MNKNLAVGALALGMLLTGCSAGAAHHLAAARASRSPSVAATAAAGPMEEACAWWQGPATSAVGDALEIVSGPGGNAPCLEVQLPDSISQDTGDSPSALTGAALGKQGFTEACSGTITAYGQSYPWTLWAMPDAGDPGFANSECQSIATSS